MGRAARGDPASFDVLVRRWKNRVFRLALRFFRRPEDAEDVTQEVFMKVYRTAGSYRMDAPFEHWLLRIATNACRDRLRALRRRPEEGLSRITAGAGGWLERALAGGAPPALHADAGEEAAAGAQCLPPP